MTLRAALGFSAYFAMLLVGSSVGAAWLRRHLMLFRIFCPRFMLGGVVLLIVDAVGVLVAVGGYRWAAVSVGEVFGWG